MFEPMSTSAAADFLQSAEGRLLNLGFFKYGFDHELGAGQLPIVGRGSQQGRRSLGIARGELSLADAFPERRFNPLPSRREGLFHFRHKP